MYKYFGLVAVAILVAGLAFVVRRWPRGVSYTFSQHVALRRSSQIYYAALFFVTMPLLVLFFVKWFVPEYNISHWFTALVASSAIAQCACTLVPETGGTRSHTHRALAGMSAVLLIPALLVLLSAGFSVVQNTGILLSAAILAGIAAIVALSRGEHRYFLVLQTLYFAFFFAPILFISYLK